jgi:hypothetical protein
LGDSHLYCPISHVYGWEWENNYTLCWMDVKNIGGGKHKGSWWKCSYEQNKPIVDMCNSRLASHRQSPYQNH